MRLEGIWAVVAVMAMLNVFILYAKVDRLAKCVVAQNQTIAALQRMDELEIKTLESAEKAVSTLTAIVSIIGTNVSVVPATTLKYEIAPCANVNDMSNAVWQSSTGIVGWGWSKVMCNKCRKEIVDE